MSSRSLFCAHRNGGKWQGEHNPEDDECGSSSTQVPVDREEGCARHPQVRRHIWPRLVWYSLQGLHPAGLPAEASPHARALGNRRVPQVRGRFRGDERRASARLFRRAGTDVPRRLVDLQGRGSFEGRGRHGLHEHARQRQRMLCLRLGLRMAAHRTVTFHASLACLPELHAPFFALHTGGCTHLLTPRGRRCRHGVHQDGGDVRVPRQRCVLRHRQRQRAH
mmetsp:Transcript_37039/g.98097  ORF Transcript_37039/g.98097 Transcript_37039/m.98097 type:complete len:222 (-) Transcript_37039:493-1158(-)